MRVIAVIGVVVALAFLIGWAVHDQRQKDAECARLGGVRVPYSGCLDRDVVIKP